MSEQLSERISGKQVFERIALTSIRNCLLEMKADGCRSGWLWLRDESEADSWVWAPLERHRETPEWAISVSDSNEPNDLLGMALQRLGGLERSYRASEALYLEVAQDLDDIVAAGLESAFMWLGRDNTYRWSGEARETSGVAISVRPDDEPLSVLCRLTASQCEAGIEGLMALANRGDRAAKLWIDILCYSTPMMEAFGYG